MIWPIRYCQVIDIAAVAQLLAEPCGEPPNEREPDQQGGEGAEELKEDHSEKLWITAEEGASKLL